MTDNQDSKIGDAVQPPTDRPLTAGDVFHFHESRMIADMAPATAVWVDGRGVLYEREDGERKWANHSPDHDITFVSRPATSAASEGEGVWREGMRVKLASGGSGTIRNIRYGVAMDLEDGSPDLGWAPQHFLDTDASDFIAALASPPVSERERELEGALAPFAAIARVMEARDRMAVGKLRDDNDVVASVSWEGGLGVLVMGHLRDALTLIPNPKGWGGLYSRRLTAHTQEPV